MKKFPAMYVLITYALTLGVVAVLSSIYPVEVASIIQRVSSPKIDLSTSDSARYRIALYLSATALLVVLFPFVWRLGAKLAVQEEGKRRTPTWWQTFVVAILVPIGWIGYPFISSCTTCWASNDTFYFLLTVFFFFALQLLIEGIVLKLTYRNGK